MEQKLEIFKLLFKGREDVFAIRWERDGKKRLNACGILDWDQYKLHKAKGRILKDFKNKEYAPLTDQRILNHLDGREIVGIYPVGNQEYNVGGE